MIDLHCHLLPGIDDGPRDMDEMVELARAAAADGFETIAATPHLRSDHPKRYNMPPEAYRLTIGNVPRHPLIGANVAVKVISRTSDQLVVELPVTDSPRLLTVPET